MSRRPPPALPPQPEDPVPVEHDSDDGDGGASMVDAWTASLHFLSMSPPRLLPPCSAWATMVVVGHLPPSPPRSPTGFIQLWEFDDEQRLPLQMGPTANCSAAVLEVAPQDTSSGIAKCRIKVEAKQNRLQINRLFILVTEFVMKRIMGARMKMVKKLVSRRLEKNMNTETGGSSLAVIESYDDDNELGDNYAEQTEISGKRPRNPQFTKRSSTQDHLERNKNKAELIRDTSRKRLKGTSRTKSVVWPHFTKLPSADPGGVMAECNHCKTTLKAGSQNGTSSLRRHLENVHQMDLSSLSEAWKEPQGSSCPQKLQITGSAACAGSPTPLTENNGNEIELQEKDFELGDTSRKRRKCTSRTKSVVWKHFTKLPSVDPGGVRARCNYCKTTLKAGSQNGTSSLRRHLEKVHPEKAYQEGS